MAKEYEELTDQDMAEIRLCTMLEEVKEAESVRELEILIGLMGEDELQLFKVPVDQRMAFLQERERARKEEVGKLSKEDLLARLEKLQARMDLVQAQEKRREAEKAPRTYDHVRYRLTEVGRTWDPGTPQMVQLLMIMRKHETGEWTEPELFEWLSNNQSMMHGRQPAVKVFKYYRMRFLEAQAVEKQNG